MKSEFLFLLFFFVLFSCSKETGPNQSNTNPEIQSFIGKIGLSGNSTIESNDNNLLTCGNIENLISILKTDKSGSLIWRKNFNLGISGKANSIYENSSNEIFVVGQTFQNQSETGIDIFLLKLNSIGDSIWVKTYGGEEKELGNYITGTSNGNLVIGGTTESFGATSVGDIYLIKLNTNGDTIWTKSFSDPDQEVPFSLITTKDNGILITGTNEDNSLPRGLYLLKVNANGKLEWDTTHGEGMWYWGSSTIELSNGDLLTSGHVTRNGFSDILILKTNNLGSIIWQKEIKQDSLSEFGSALINNNDNSFTITGSSFDQSKSDTDLLVTKINNIGDTIWFRKLKDLPNDRGSNIIIDENKNTIITGQKKDSIIIIRFDQNGNPL